MCAYSDGSTSFHLHQRLVECSFHICKSRVFLESRVMVVWVGRSPNKIHGPEPLPSDKGSRGSSSHGCGSVWVIQLQVANIPGFSDVSMLFLHLKILTFNKVQFPRSLILMQIDYSPPSFPYFLPHTHTKRQDKRLYLVDMRHSGYILWLETI